MSADLLRFERGEHPDYCAISIVRSAQPKHFPLIYVPKRHPGILKESPARGARSHGVEVLRSPSVILVEPYQYWIDNDSVAFLDPDGREVIFAPWIFGKEPTPARRKAG
jgi:hypothetical protein